VKEHALNCLIDDPGAGEEEEARFDQRREVFDLAVAVGVVAVGRLIGVAHGQQGDDGGHQVQSGMGGLGQDAQALGHEADDQLEGGKKQSGAHGDGRHVSLFFFCNIHRD